MISVVLATHNEEKNLAKCLDAIKTIADEIIIADGESTDDTVKIAKQYKAKVIKTTNKLNFHINKQMAMDEAKGDLVLQLDADEIVDAEFRKFITQIHKKLVKTQKSEIDTTFEDKAWWVPRKNFFLGRFMKKGGQYPDATIRLYINGYAELPQRDVHEQMNVEGNVGWADGHLMHYANPTFADYLRKFNTYTSLKAVQLKEAGEKVNLINTVNFLFIKPVVTFFNLYFRHKGLMDGMAGLVFACFSGCYHVISYLKLWELYLPKDAKKN